MSTIQGLLGSILALIIFHSITFFWFPGVYGKLMRDFDEARYEQIDCDCTGELKE